MRKRNRNRNSERGVSLVLSILALMLLSAIAVGMVFMASTEASITSNFKSEETSYFAARAGVEEVRDRMLINNPNTINALLPAAMPPAASSVLYVLNGATPAQIMDLTTPYGDDDLCHDWGNPSVIPAMTWEPANARCAQAPPAGVFVPTPSVAPYPLDYKWVRVTLKRNDSATYSAPYNRVDAAQPAGNQVCWDGVSEVVLPTGTANCFAMLPVANPVYMVTALAVTQSGARRLTKIEIAQTPPPYPPGGLFATGTGCDALTIAGNAQTGSFNSATEGVPTNPPSNITSTGGDIGANGGLDVGGTSTSVNGAIATNMPATVGACPGNGISVSGSPSYGSPLHLPTTYNAPVPPMPNPPPPQTSKTYKNVTLPPGAYGNVTIQGTVTLAGGTPGNPAVYTINSINFNGGAQLIINGPVVINLAGVGVNTALDMTGGSFSNSTYVPSNFVINYGGTDKMVVSGGTAAYAVINAPNAPLSFYGGSNFYGQAVGASINDQGGTNFYWDAATHAPTPNPNPYYEISMRELSY